MLPLNLATNPKPRDEKIMVTIVPMYVWESSNRLCVNLIGGWWRKNIFSPTRKAPQNNILGGYSSLLAMVPYLSIVRYHKEKERVSAQSTQYLEAT
jgi:hypothetical protein